jgi:hypothetical protein
MHRMALNKAKLFNRSRRFRGEIGTVVSFPRYDPMAVNQRVAGSSPADGANNHKAFKDEGQSRVALFGNNLGNNTPNPPFPCNLLQRPLSRPQLGQSSGS